MFPNVIFSFFSFLFFLFFVFFVFFSHSFLWLKTIKQLKYKGCAPAKSQRGIWVASSPWPTMRYWRDLDHPDLVEERRGVWPIRGGADGKIERKFRPPPLSSIAACLYQPDALFRSPDLAISARISTAVQPFRSISLT